MDCLKSVLLVMLPMIFMSLSNHVGQNNCLCLDYSGTTFCIPHLLNGLMNKMVLMIVRKKWSIASKTWITHQANQVSVTAECFIFQQQKLMLHHNIFSYLKALNWQLMTGQFMKPLFFMEEKVFSLGDR